MKIIYTKFAAKQAKRSISNKIPMLKRMSVAKHALANIIPGFDFNEVKHIKLSGDSVWFIMPHKFEYRITDFEKPYLRIYKHKRSYLISVMVSNHLGKKAEIVWQR